ncbi:MAG: hypothetical protein PHP57_06360 [Sideroxydans sp.]|nr:hypothetical protein [Sideroxydans sp.]
MDKQTEQRALEAMSNAFTRIRWLSRQNKILSEEQTHYIFELSDAVHNLPEVMQLEAEKIRVERFKSDIEVVEKLLNKRVW